MKKPFVSIIITVLNGGKTLAKSLESIQAQTFDDYELVLVDGGSSDNTLEIFVSSKISNKVKEVLPGANIYQGLNRGVEMANGQWLYFMGADDQLFDNNILKTVYEIIKLTEDDIEVFIGKVKCIKQREILEPLLGLPVLLRHRVHHQGMFYKANLFRERRYDESKQIASDYKFNLELALTNIKHKAIDTIIAKFGGEGVSETRSALGYYEMQLIHNELFRGLKKIWVINLFTIRRAVGAILRHNNLKQPRVLLKRIFG